MSKFKHNIRSLVPKYHQFAQFGIRERQLSAKIGIATGIHRNRLLESCFEMFNQFVLILSNASAGESAIGNANCNRDLLRLFLRTYIFAICLVGLMISVGSGVVQECRSFGGSGNNLSNPNWGSNGNVLGRLMAPDNSNGVDALPTFLPNPRFISDRFFSQTAYSVQGCRAYLAGDVRANEYPGLMVLITAIAMPFVRRHE